MHIILHQPPGMSKSHFTNKNNTHTKHVLISACFDNGEKEKVARSLHEHLTEIRVNSCIAKTHEMPVLPIKLCAEWPPAQCGKDGVNQNKSVFNTDLLFQNWSDKQWNPRKCAEDIKASLENMGLLKK